MGFIRRGFLYVTRKKGKSALLLLIFLIMATFVLTGLSVEKAAQMAQGSLRQSLGGEFKIVPDSSKNNPYFKMKKDGEGNVSVYTERLVTKDMIQAIMDLGGIKSYDATAQCLVKTKLNVLSGNVPLKEKYKDMVYAQIVAGTENNSFFQSGILKLAQGSHIAMGDRNVAVISQDLAEKNSLNIGDVIPLQGDEKADVRIIGIYEIMKNNQAFANVPTYDKLENQIFTDLATYEALIPKIPGQTAGFVRAIFQVEDPAQLGSIISQAKDLPSIDWRAFTVETNAKAYKDAAAPLLKIQNLVAAILAIIVAASVVILSLILTMWARSRIHETGVFLSLGIGKASIIGQYLTEALVIGIFAFGLSFFTSNGIANQLANHLLWEHVKTSETMASKPGYEMNVKEGAKEGIGGDIKVSMKNKTSGSSAGPQEGSQALAQGASGSPPPNPGQLNVSIGLENMALLYLMGLTMIVLSVGISSAVVMGLKPREILSKMS